MSKPNSLVPTPDTQALLDLVALRGTVHGILGMGRLLQAGRDALDLIAARIRSLRPT